MRWFPAQTLLTLLILAGCNGDKEGETGVIATDEDGDGFASDVDCDDDDAAVNPDAVEACDGVDNDCDGDIDDGLTQATWYQDDDGDSYGDETDTLEACAQPEGYVAVAGDCDDLDTSYFPGAPEDDCSDPNDYNCDGSVGYTDADGDRYPACLECDDSNGDAYPGADETCNGVDDDCDGDVDDDALDADAWYIDYDTDGYGSDRYEEIACEQPSGFVANQDDCDDTDDNAYPGADELCDGSDNDCDGETDEDSALDVSVWYSDADGDGYGVPDATMIACDLPAGYAATDDDCDDAVFEVNPGATERCNDGVDDDCDGEADGSDAEGVEIFYVDADGDGYGLDDFTITACELPEAYSTIGGDCYDDGTAFGASINPDADEICDELDNDCDDLVDEDGATDATTWYADLDLDGYGGETSFTTSCAQPDGYGPTADDCDDGDDQVFPGATETCNDGVDSDCNGLPDGCEITASNADTIITGEGANHSFANAMAGPADIDGDGEPDLLMNAPLADSVDTDVGAVYIGLGELDSGEVGADSVGVVINGADSLDDRAGSSSAAADLDEDGYDDVMVGAIRFTQTPSGTQRGGAYVLFGPLSGELSLKTDYDARYVGSYQFQRLGLGVEGASDLDDDGSLDLILGAGTHDGSAGGNTGGVFVMLGPVDASSSDINVEDADATIDGDTAGDGIGGILATGFDVDGDGVDDLAVGNKACTSDALGSSVGCVYVISDYADGTNDIGDVSDILYGEASGDNFGNKVNPAGDVDGDGYDDLVIGALGNDETGENAGAAYLVYGPVTAGSVSGLGARFLGDAAGASMGTGVAGDGDADGDGTFDLLVSAPGADYSDAADAGAAYLYLGPFLDGDYGADDAYATVYGDDVSAKIGSAVQFGGAVGDAVGDRIFISATEDDRAGSSAGVVFVFEALGL